MKTRYSVVLTLLVVVSMVLALTANLAAEEQQLKFAYICKMLTHPWFIAEETGIKEKTAELGIDYIGIDANLNDEQCLQAVDAAIAQGVDAIMLVVTNQGLGPVIAEQCREAGVALLTIDDTIMDDEGKQVHHVGLPTFDLGYYGSKALAELAREKGFFEEGNIVRPMLIDLSTISVTRERTLGYMEGFREYMPEVPEEEWVVVDSTPSGMIEDAMRVASAAFSAHPDVTHWLITGINDDGAIGGLRVLEERNFPIENVISCGLGGYELSLNEFKKDHESYICTILFPDEEGRAAVEILYNYLIHGEPMPEFTSIPEDILVATWENWEEFFPGGELPW